MNYQIGINFQKILKFYQQDDSRNTVEIDEEKKLFVDQVLESMTVTVNEEIWKNFDAQTSDCTGQAKINCQLLRESYYNKYIHGFSKMNDVNILLNCCKDTNHNFCNNAIKIVAEMSQNSTICQEYFLKYGMVELLTGYLNNDDLDLVAIALYALSALTQHFEPASTEFIKNGGIKRVADCLSTKSSRVFIKSCALIISMSSEFSSVKDEFAKQNVLSNLTKKLRIVDCYHAEMEMALRTMTVLLESHFCNLIKDKIDYVTYKVKSVLKSTENLPECEEIASYSNAVLKQLEARN